jgi:hypothetical protein
LALCVLEQIWWEMRLWCWIVHEFMFISCYWWLLNYWNWIGVTGIAVYGFVRRFVVVLVFWENFVILMKWTILLFLMLESCLFKCIEHILTHKHFLELGLGVGDLKNGVLGENDEEPVTTAEFRKNCANSPNWANSEISQKQFFFYFANSPNWANSEIAQKQFFLFCLL